MDKAFDCVVVGSCVVDVLARPVPLSEPIGGGRLIESEPLLLTTGGIVSNSGITLARLGMRVAAFTYVGNDEWADVIRRRYAAEGIDTSALVTHPDRRDQHDGRAHRSQRRADVRALRRRAAAARQASDARRGSTCSPRAARC